jgi:hypothetical protein
MFGITAAVGVMAAHCDVALVIEQSVKNMQGFARRHSFGIPSAIAPPMAAASPNA